MKEIEIKLAFSATDIAVKELCRTLCAAHTSRAPEMTGSETGTQWAIRYGKHVALEEARIDLIRAAIMADLSEASGQSDTLEERISLATLAKFAYKRGLKVTQDRAVASRPSPYDVALERLLDAQSSVDDHEKTASELAEAQRVTAADAASPAYAGPPLDADSDPSFNSDIDGEHLQENAHTFPTVGTPTGPELLESDYYDPDDDALSKTEKKIRRIVWLAVKLGYLPTSIPYGGKAHLSKECRKKWPFIFGIGEDSFEGAWKKSGERLRTENHYKYLPK